MAGQTGQPNFFDLLFGKHRKTQQQPGFNSGTSPWWYDKQGQQASSGKSRRGLNAASLAAGDGTDPEQITGLGMGLVEYAPPVVTPVYDASFIALQEGAPDAEAIRVMLSDKATPIKAQEVERKAVLSFYKANGFKPVWSADGHLTARADEVLKLLAAAPADGLVAKNYLPEVLTSFDGADAAVAGDAIKQARLDIGLTVAALHYARQISGGQFEPARMSLYNDIKPEYVNADEALKALAENPAPAAYLSGLAPKNAQYAIFKAELAKLAASNAAAFTPIASGPTIKPGKLDARIPAIRARLVTLGFIADAAAPTGPDANKLDQDLTIGLMAFQTANAMKPSGTIDVATLKALNRDNAGDQRQKLVSSMERLRWLPKNLGNAGNRYVFVNQAAFEASVMQGDKTEWKTRVIVGQPTKQTYSFSDQIQTVVFNPKWGVPASIIVNEYVPKMRRDPGYLDRNGFIVVDKAGNEIGSSSVDWWSVGKNPDFGIQQLAGDGNALGELKFLFPNAHDIYMHDTPTKKLFADPVRAYSHGCVRVQNPREFAQVLLGWNKDQVEKGLAIQDTHSIQLPQKVPVHLTYFTAWPDENGVIHYYDDIYGRDGAMAKAFAYDPNGKKSGGDIVAQTLVNGSIIQN
ncbi:MAG: L,D-transpeptidase family protein [Alphaproteobacteria bacterium]|nr:L,D-transpeptidase family protein [Alphaproteobacteria bacterium]